MRPLNVLSNGAHVAVPLIHLQEFHAPGMGWYECEKLRFTMTHEQALAAPREKWTELGYGHQLAN